MTLREPQLMVRRILVDYPASRDAFQEAVESVDSNGG